jgi:hypothetical protein
VPFGWALEHLSKSGVDGDAADLAVDCLTAVSSGFIARLDFGELARWGHEMQEVASRKQEVAIRSCYFLLPASYFLALSLLVLRVLTNHANHTATVNHLALVADLLY